jgi:hypothetical protein
MFGRDRTLRESRAQRHSDAAPSLPALAWASAVSWLVRFAAGKKRQTKKRSARAVSWLVRFAVGKGTSE